MGPHLDVVRERLADHGFIEGRNLQITWRGNFGVGVEYRKIARDMVAMQPDALLTFSTATTLAVQSATKSIPIVFTHVGDPIVVGIVKNYARPGGNATGISTRQGELLAKLFELLREFLPRATRVALVVPSVIDPYYLASERAILEIAEGFNFDLFKATYGRLFEIEEKRAEAMLVLFSESVSRLRTENMIALAAKLRIASVFPDAESVALGGLASYGANLLEETRLGVDQLVRVLKGAKPGELPVIQSSRFTLAINLKTAQSLGLTVPLSLLLRADRVFD